MESAERRQKTRYVLGIVLNGVISLAIVLGIFLIAAPKYEELSSLIDHINATNAEAESLRVQGVDVPKFEALLQTSGRRKELSSDVFSDRARLSRVLVKPAGTKGDYVTWTTAEAGTIDSINEEIANNDRILGNIIPNYVPDVSETSSADSNPIRNQVNLQSFVNYVEQNILAKYSLSSFAPIGINNITFDSTKTSTVNIGSFRLSLDFTGKNSDIYAFVDAIQKSWSLTIRDGKLVPSDTEIREKWDDQLSSLSNLLVTIPSLNLTSTLENNTKQNGGTIVLEFYVEGMNYQKVLLLRSSLATRFDVLKKKIKDGGDLCNNVNNPICQDGAGNGAVSAIKNLSRSVGELQQKVESLRRGSTVTDIGAELDNLLSLQATIDGLEKTYERNNSIVNKLKDKLNHKDK